MTLQEALKKKRDYKRKNDREWMVFGCTYSYITGDLLADDYEVKLEVYEVECDISGMESCCFPQGKAQITTFMDISTAKAITGKRTKLTIEVLD